MSVTAKILRILVDGGRDTDDMILLAEAMERGPNARIVFQFVNELEDIGSSPDTLAASLCAMARAILANDVPPPVYNGAGDSSGPKARWGYDGPITPRLPDKEWWPLRNSILERDDYTCRYCGVRAERMCADHVVPLTRGGSNDPDNLVAACVSCNSSKCDMLLEEWHGRLYR